jgi:hypothetical protein
MEVMMFSKAKQSPKRANLIQMYLRPLRQSFELTVNPDEMQEDPGTELAGEAPPVYFDSWGIIHAGSECWSCLDPSSILPIGWR